MEKFENEKMNKGYWFWGILKRRHPPILSFFLTKFYQYLKLSKWLLSAAITLSAVVGFYLNTNAIQGNVWFLIVGVFLLSSGASAINQYMERNQDRIMPRTQNRPIPMGFISPKQAIIFSIVSIVLGSFFLLHVSAIAMLLGLVNVLLYDFIYTPLKYRSQFALLAGGLVGALPPLMGWYASGTIDLDKSIVVFATFMFVWQIPHFFLLLIKYRKDYELVNAIMVFKNNEELVPQVFFIWFLATCIVSFMFPLLGLFSFAQTVMLYVLNIGFIALFARLLYVKPIRMPSFIYISLHFFLIFHFVLLLL